MLEVKHIHISACSFPGHKVAQCPWRQVARPSFQRRSQHHCAPSKTVASLDPNKGKGQQSSQASHGRSGSKLKSFVQNYPVTVALGSLIAVLAVSRLATLGLVGFERAILGLLLEIEQVLVTIFLAGARWVLLALIPLGLLASVWFETHKKRS